MKLSKILPALFFLFAFIIISSCKKNKVEPNDPPPTQEELFITECGKIPPVFGCIKAASLFIPNAFTPNNDGINDIFFPFGMSEAMEVVSFKIYNEMGTLIFESYSFGFNDPAYGWDGKLSDGSIQDGIFNYTISVETLFDETAEFEGSVCCRTGLPISCVENEKHIAWGTQHDGNGGFDVNLPSYEDCE